MSTGVGAGRRGAGPAPRPGPQAAGEAGPGCQSTTQENSSHPILMVGSSDCTISGGIDWFEWTALVDFGESPCFKSIAAQFQSAKEYSQSIRIKYTEVIVPGFGTVRVHRNGINRGGERGQHFEYRIKIAGATFGLSPRIGDDLLAGRKRQHANFYVVQTGRDCLLFGAHNGYQRAIEFLAVLGGTPADMKVSRADLCLDVCNLATERLNALVASGRFITKAKVVRPDINYVTDCVTGFSAGKSPMRLCVYDKLLERMGKADGLYNRA